MTRPCPSLLNLQILAVVTAVSMPASGHAQSATPMPQPAPVFYVSGIQPVLDHDTYIHALLEQFEGRFGRNGSQFRYDGQAWFGTDYDKLWLKSEGTIGVNRQFGDGSHQALYSRAIMTYFDLQAGVRVDADSGPTRTWGAIGIQGLALYFFDIETTAFFSDRGVAGRITGSYDILLTNRLILQPQVEMNFYSASDYARTAGKGLSDIDAGLRLRYEGYRKFAPYIGVTYAGSFGQAAQFAREKNDRVRDLRFTFGVRSWF